MNKEIVSLKKQLAPSRREKRKLQSPSRFGEKGTGTTDKDGGQINERPVTPGDLAATIYHHMAGPSEFRIIGTLRGWDIMHRLGSITVPTLVTCGEYDECRPVHTRQVAERIPGSRLEIIPGASHLSFVERPDLFMPLVNGFLAEVETAARV